jgi:hypothetical protein
LDLYVFALIPHRENDRAPVKGVAAPKTGGIHLAGERTDFSCGLILDKEGRLFVIVGDVWGDCGSRCGIRRGYKRRAWKRT